MNYEMIENKSYNENNNDIIKEPNDEDELARMLQDLTNGKTKDILKI